MSRLGRSQPVQPFAAHGFLGNTPANGVLPGRIVVVENDDRRRKTPPLQPVVISAALIVTAPVTASPPAPVVVPADRQRQRVTPDPVVVSGNLAAVATPVTVTPPAPVVVVPPDRRQRVTPDPVVLDGLPAALAELSVTPPAPTVVPVDQRRRPTADPVTTVGPLDDPAPPAPVNLDRVDQRGRYRPLDPIALSAALQATAAPPDVTPPGPYVVPIEERRWILDRLRQPTSTHGFLGNTPANGVLPPAGQNIDRADQRVRFLPQPSLVLSGVLIPFVPPPPVTVNPGTDWAAEMSTW